MPGIYLTALITTAVAMAGFGTLIYKLRQPADARLLWVAAAVALPLQPLAFYLLRVPLDHWLAAQLGAKSSAYQWLVTLYAPLTEEPAKLLPLLLPSIRRDLRVDNFVRYALAIGLGFAVGEMWFVAEKVTHQPALAALPFYQFGGYFSERLMTCVFHSAFVAVALWQLRRRFALGVAGAMALHWLGNFPISLMAWNVGRMGKAFWSGIVLLWLLFYLAGAIVFLVCLTMGRTALGVLLHGRRRCPECAREYDAPILLGFNFGSTRYERCPHCRHWHWTTPVKPK